MSYLCVDGGQTKTAVVLVDDGGREIGAWHAGPLTTPSKPGAMNNLRAVVRSIARILDEAAGHLADIVRAVLRRLGDLPVYPSGASSARRRCATGSRGPYSGQETA
jgi:hypothetical protein